MQGGGETGFRLSRNAGICFFCDVKKRCWGMNVRNVENKMAIRYTRARMVRIKIPVIFNITRCYAFVGGDSI